MTRAVFEFEKHKEPERRTARQDVAALQEAPARDRFALAFSSVVAAQGQEKLDVQSEWDLGMRAMHSAQKTLPITRRKRHQPWISKATLHLIHLRWEACGADDAAEERRSHKECRKSVKLDKERWLEALLGDGDWQQIRKLRQPKRATAGKLRDSSGKLVESDQRANTMAIHLETVQWKMRQCDLVEGDPLGENLPVQQDMFKESEVRAAAMSLKRSRASGPDGIPGEFWQAVARWFAVAHAVVQAMLA